MSDFSNFPTQPVRVTDEAGTFTESGITLKNRNTTVANGSIELGQLPSFDIIDDFEDADINVKSANWSGWNLDTASLDAQQGVVIDGNYSGELTASAGNQVFVEVNRGSATTNNINVTIRSNDTGASGDETQIKFANPNTTLLTLTFNDNNGDVTASGSQVATSWQADTAITIRFVWDFNNDEVDIILNGESKGTFSFENSANDFDTITFRNDAISLGSGTREVYIDNLKEQTGLSGGPASSGNALVAFDSGVPDDISSYDLATFQSTSDNEIIAIDLEDSNGNVLKSDISKDTDISDIATSKDVQLRANLSRNDTANNPTVDYLARRFTR